MSKRPSQSGSLSPARSAVKELAAKVAGPDELVALNVRVPARLVTYLRVLSARTGTPLQTLVALALEMLCEETGEV